jgi:hypothetical protein
LRRFDRRFTRPGQNNSVPGCSRSGDIRPIFIRVVPVVSAAAGVMIKSQVGRQAQQSMNNGGDNESYPDFLVDPEGGFYPAQAAGKLKKQQQQVDQTQPSDDGQSGDVHRSIPLLN